jgi:hypothetical protein
MPLPPCPPWLTEDVVKLARAIEESSDRDLLGPFADALLEAGLPLGRRWEPPPGTKDGKHMPAMPYNWHDHFGKKTICRLHPAECVVVTTVLWYADAHFPRPKEWGEEV